MANDGAPPSEPTETSTPAKPADEKPRVEAEVESAAPARKPVSDSAPSLQPPPPDRRALVRKLAWLALPIVLVVVAIFALSRGPVRFEKGVEITSVVLPAEVARGGTLPVEIHFKSAAPLAPEQWIFLHVEAIEGTDKACRMVHDRPAPPGLNTAWTGAEVVHKVDVPVPATCNPAQFRVYTGIWNTKEGDRLHLLDPGSLDDRLPAADVEIVDGAVQSPPRALDGAAIKRHARFSLFTPWVGWVLGVLAAAVLAILAARRVQEKDDLARDALPREMKLAAFVLPATALVLGILVVLEFVKDDAYISFRYAHNLVTGKGLVFNPGDKLEGFTNFLWTLLMAPFEALGWDLFQVCEVLGTALSLGVIAVMLSLAIKWDQARKDLSFAWATIWLATSSSWVLWAKSGLEQSLAALLPLASAALLWSAQERVETDEKRGERNAVLSGVLMGLGCMTRPEIHAIAAIVGAPLLVDAVRRRSLPRLSLKWAIAVVAITLPFHLFRYGYYHSLLPNTFYVKTGKGDLIWRAGLDQLHEMFLFNNLGWVVLFVPFAFMTRKRLVPKLVALAISLAFMAYMVKVGVDEMQWFRLYLPALPFMLLLAALGMRNLLDAAASLLSPKDPAKATWLLAAVGWGVVMYAGAQNFQFTYRELHGFDGHGDLSGMYHPDLGKFLVRHERPGGLVAFQDMGSTPYHAPDIDFLDFIGLTEGHVARARNAYGLHAFVPTEGKAKKQYDAEMREYFFQKAPEWTILTVYPPRDQEQAIAERFDHDPSPAAIGNAYFNNSYQFGLWGDQRFHDRYVHVRTWQRSRGYYLSLFRRKDLWDQTPREVVLDAPPADLSGPKSDFANGVSMIGGKVDPPSTLERHETFITTWWKVPGPLDKDLTIFVHVSRQGFQAPLDHIPGDSMYPADRWKEGQIVEDRVLFQLPINMKPGKYDVYVGLYRRSTGERIKITSGANDGTGRVLVGSFEVKKLLPFVHQLIPPTHVDVMRKYPDRIIDSHQPH